jgi:hypothetical protein
MTVSTNVAIETCLTVVFTIYRVIHKSLRHFRPLRYSSRDGHAEGEHVNRGRDTPSFCPTLQVLDMSTLGDTKKRGDILYLLICSFQLCLSWLLHSQVWKFQRDLQITLYSGCITFNTYNACCITMHFI